MSTIICNFDGACEPVNPGGNMGVGIVVKQADKILFSQSTFVPADTNNSNNVAEYMGLIGILEFLLEDGLQDENILIRGDSKLVIMQIKGAWKIKAGRYVEYAHKARELARSFTKIRFEWIPRELNGDADKLSKGEMIEAGVEFKIQPEK